MHFVGVVDEFVLGHFFFDVHGLEFFQEWLLVLEKAIQSEAFTEAKFVFFGELASLFFGDNLRFIIVLEEIFEFGLIENNDSFVDNGNLVVFGHFEGDFGREGLEAFAIDFPGAGAFQRGGSRDGFGNIECLGAAVFAVWIGEASDDAFNFFEVIFVFGEVVDILVLVFDKMDEGFGAADLLELSVINDFFFAIGLFVFTTFEAFVGFFNNKFNSFGHKHRFDGAGQFVGIFNLEGSVIFVKKK